VIDKPSLYFPFGFHLSRSASRAYEVPGLLPLKGGWSRRQEIQAIRLLSDRINASRTGEGKGGEFVSAGQLIVLGLVEEIFRYVMDRYWVEEVPGSLEEGLEYTRARVGSETVEVAVPAFVEFFPPWPVEKGEMTGAEFLSKTTDPLPNRLAPVRELVLLSMAVSNPAMAPYQVLFDDSDLKKRTPYPILIEHLETFFEGKPPIGPLGLKLFKALRAPMRACPHSLGGQLDFILQNWGDFLPAELRKRLLLGLDLLKEENRPRAHGPGPAEVLRFGKAGRSAQDLESYPEFERFSQDLDWMSNVVMIAKTVYVWLDQLSKQYQRPITRLDEIPDREIDQLAGWGFNALWLIGVWERSPASERIKQIRGNPEAVASAYSLMDYAIAADLGGETAYESLRSRASERGIHLASDMVPNHMGLDSRWVIEHPDWFVQLDHPPFPTYTFNGPNLSHDDRVGLYIDDGYWDHRDAAVVFKRVDSWTGNARYIYHGNDGTHMPWNDTAQLNYLIPEVREAVIQTILHVARKFPIIRFDAAMTLAKKHYQRLWFPAPGQGGDIPSRAEHGIDRAEFNAAMPEEFWREVVDRVAAEAPNTLLLAEAFWLMEGYFVRTLGMHRVYNSAFMNMLKTEDNSNYRQTIKNVLEFSPEVLKRFVNFMNNPDEKTAVEQFGKDDKYFGVCLLLVTMPGLPMIGHGQIEGYSEKYGMEYRKAYWNEMPDEGLIHRHEAEIFPLMRRRYLFSGVEHFAFYDFHTPEGHVNEDVFAYSNRTRGERALILYNNAYRTTSGWIKNSTPINMGRQDEANLERRTLADALGLDTGMGMYVIFRDHKENLEYLRLGSQIAEEGLFVQLGPYHYHAFVDFREVHDEDGSWARLAAHLAGTGVPNISDARRELELAPLLDPFRAVIDPALIEKLADALHAKGKGTPLWNEVSSTLDPLIAAAAKYKLAKVKKERILSGIKADLKGLKTLEVGDFECEVPLQMEDFLAEILPAGEDETASYRQALILWSVLRHVGEIFIKAGKPLGGTPWMEEWMLAPNIARVFVRLGLDEWKAEEATNLIRAMIGHPEVLSTRTPKLRSILAKRMFEDPAVRNYLLVNTHGGIEWLRKERIDTLMPWLLLSSVVALLADDTIPQEEYAGEIKVRYDSAVEILGAAVESGYQVKRTLEMLTP
jgi:glycosidase